ncbi:hypothetical protein TVAG_015640, partial [Trichomonas vaginalis G3]
MDSVKLYIRRRYIEIVKELIKYYPKEDHYSIFAEAISIGSYELVEYMIYHGFDFHSASIDGKTPIFDAILYNQVDILQLLIKSGAELEFTNIYGETALMAATSMLSQTLEMNDYMKLIISYNPSDSLKLLINQGVNYHALNKNGHNVTQNAIINGLISAWNVLSPLSLPPLTINQEEIRELREKLKDSDETLFTYISKHDDEWFYAVHNSIFENNDKYPDVNEANKYGETPVMCVIKYNKNPALLALLITAVQMLIWNITEDAIADL